MRRPLVAILAGLAVICVVAVVDVTLLGGDGKYRRGGVARDCLALVHPITVDIEITP